jgi:DNA-binding CsgD family transcriptional regulator
LTAREPADEAAERVSFTEDAMGIEYGREASEIAVTAREALLHAIAGIPGDGVSLALQAVAEEMPVACSLEFVNVRLLGSDRKLHLVAAAGCTTLEIRKRAFQPLAVARVRDTVDSGEQAAVGLSLGARWMHVEWLRARGEDAGTIAVGCRTKRRPTESDLAMLAGAAEELGTRLAGVDRRAATLRGYSLRLARTASPVAWAGDGAVEDLRPREQTILELYADGLSTADIAELLVISPHTVRTHVKLAMRRLGVHTRAEAAGIVRADQIAQLL